MKQVRAARGWWVLGHRRLVAHLIATLALALGGLCAPLAGGASGDTGTSPTPAGGSGTSPTSTPTTTPTTPTTTSTTPGPTTPASTPAIASVALTGRGMWIWELPSSSGGDLAQIVRKAKRNGVRTLLIKSSDGSSLWSQFTAQLVATLHANGLRVCAWQYVYGFQPLAEAGVGAAAVTDGADCLVIDAETEYEGKYVQAQQYISRLRTLIGASFPVALAGFPYVDYHPGFPYSVFLGPGGAQYNAPQMYWVDIGTTVDEVYSHTYEFNRLYQRTIFPLGQIYNSPPPNEVARFRQLSVGYGASGVSWWDWQETTNAGWRAVSRPRRPLTGFTPDATVASIGWGAQGDLVVWAQQHLVSAGQKVPIVGAFGPKTKRAVKRFQAAHGLPVTGIIDATTWYALLQYVPAPVQWGAPAKGARASAASADQTRLTPVPESASRPAVRNEIAGAGGAGRSRRH